MRSKVSKSIGFGLALALCAAGREHARVDALQVKPHTEPLREVHTTVAPTLLEQTNTSRWSDNSGVLCVISRQGAGCAHRSVDIDGFSYQGASCPKDLCCSKTACHIPHGCGAFCESSWALCSTSIVYHKDKSYGGDCSCEKQGHRCHQHAVCVENLNPGGGARCECVTGFMGDGIHCEPDACLSEGWNPCGIHGACVPHSVDRYSCECYDNFERILDSDGKETCGLKPGSVCRVMGGNCKAGRCVEDPNNPHGYRCECPPNQFHSDVGEPTCVSPCEETGGETDCRPGSCRATGTSSYACECPNGYREGVGSGDRSICEPVLVETPEQTPQTEEQSHSSEQEKEEESGEEEEFGEEDGESGETGGENGGISGEIGGENGGISGEIGGENGGISGENGGISGEIGGENGGISGEIGGENGGISGEIGGENGSISGEIGGENGGISGEIGGENGGNSGENGGISGEIGGENGGMSGEIGGENGGNSGEIGGENGGISGEIGGENGGMSGEIGGENGGISGEIGGENGSISGEIGGENGGISGEIGGENGGISGEIGGENGGNSGEIGGENGGISGEIGGENGGNSGEIGGENGGISGETGEGYPNGDSSQSGKDEAGMETEDPSGQGPEDADTKVYKCVDNICHPGKCQETSPGKMECMCPPKYVRVYRADSAYCVFGPQ
ncbi:putative collagen [Besnoitia besnoiti]|uniref:Putative collagen n=1 Tax=Besnoitia besnoiti TaxID=94643 RepID=A0A2A9MKT4_BESBE|nr:putative collagen [Besnoitia besnoiti]PFH36237.1 putative collagen [Besnoitia besnoiti]